MKRLFLATVVACVLAACSSAPQQGYGAITPQSTDAMLRQQVANQDPVPDNRGMYLSVIQEMQGKGLYFASLAHIDAFELKYDAAPDIELLRARALREAGQPEQSEAVYRKLLDTPVGAAAAQGIGLIAGARGDYAGAIASLRDAARRDPTNPQIVGDLGFALLKQGDLAAARVPIAQAAELAPDNPKVLANLAVLLLVSGQPERADAVMAKADLPPDTQAAVRRMASEMVSAKAPVTPAAAIAQAVPVAQAAPVAAPAPAALRAVPSPAASVAPPASNPMAVSPGSAPMQRMLDRFGSEPTNP